jgi:hypothetical protein
MTLAQSLAYPMPLQGSYSSANLPAASAYPIGTPAATSDLGVQYSNGLTWQSSPIMFDDALSQIFFIPTALTTAAVIAAAQAASVVGGAIVQLPPGTLTLTQSLPLLSGVTYNGCGYNLSNSGSPVLTGGTIIQGNGTFPLFAANSTDLGAPYTTQAQLLNSWINCPEVSNMGLSNGSYGIKCGALYQGGCEYGYFHGLFIQNCTAWGMWMENVAQCSFERISYYFNAHGMMVTASGTTLWNMGNSHFSKITGGDNTAQGSGRVLQLSARSSSNQNNLSVFDLGGSGATVTNTQAATMSASSSTIGVTDLTQYGVGMPVIFSASVNGFVATQIYFVLSVSGASGAGSITVANSIGGASGSVALVATGSTAVNITHHGWPVFEAGTADAGSVITYCSVKGASDLENGGTAHIVLQGLNGFDLETGITHSAISAADICIRGLFGQQGIRINLQNVGVVCDFDSTAQRVQMYGAAPTIFNANYQGIGFTANGTSGFGQLSIRGQGPDLTASGNFFNTLVWNFPIALNTGSIATGATIAVGNGNNMAFTTAAGGTLTLPALNTNMVGWEVRIANPQANAVVVSSAAQNINYNGTLTLTTTVAANTNAFLIAMNNGGTMFWARMS